MTLQDQAFDRVVILEVKTTLDRSITKATRRITLQMIMMNMSSEFKHQGLVCVFDSNIDMLLACECMWLADLFAGMLTVAEGEVALWRGFNATQGRGLV